MNAKRSGPIASPQPFQPNSSGQSEGTYQSPISMTHAENAELGNLKTHIRDDRFDRVSTNQNVVNMIIKRAREDGVTFVSSSDLEKLAALQIRYDRARASVMAHTYNAAREAYRVHIREVKNRLMAGVATPEDEIWSEADFHEDFEIRLHAAKQECRDITSEGFPIAVAAAKKIGEVAAKWAKEMEAEERKKAEEFGFHFVPSAILLSIQKVADRPQKCLPIANGSAYPPKHLIDFATNK
ncbi:MAG TPA: hypothetical protein VFM25_01815 [Verrucomicrobiae bacterium]|nr:hypothetical protein [Verrucomicrobiae bacterium]